MASQSTTASRLNPALADLPMLDDKQAGSLRHYHNLMAQLDGDWTHMQGDDPDNVSDESGFRYQLGYMAYALATAHVHQLPAAPGVFRKTFDRALHKMMRRECWAYWQGMSASGPQYDPDITEPRKAWWDPVVKENIMYSGHLNAMAALYNYLFDTDKYDRMGAIRFEAGALDTFNRGAAVEYSLQTLNDAIYWQMVETGFVGVACQPNWIFGICNQFPIWGFRFHDVRTGASVAEEVTLRHKAAWQGKGGYTAGQAMPFMVRQKQDEVWDADWSGGYYLINSWNPEYFQSVYGLAKSVLLCRDEQGRLQPRPVGQTGRARRSLAAGETPPPLNREVIERPNGTAMMIGYTAVTLAEAGDPDLAALLDYADQNMAPQWKDGGYYYPRSDQKWGPGGNFHGVCPHSGNITYGWARLNVKDGLRDLYARPWGRDHFAEPNLADVSDEVDVLRARFLPEDNRLALTVKPMHGSAAADAKLAIANMRRPGQRWTLSIGDEVVASGDSEAMSGAGRGASFADGALTVEQRVTGATDVVVDWT